MVVVVVTGRGLPLGRVVIVFLWREGWVGSSGESRR